ncbi:hypothetical protein [Microvirga brassicacearum]|uniref:Uncharacterized protein n=1 Tax=Microvirga brassicacearum TaxID=2580413 RepID=A0A5N3P3Y2_9HYPH|nr:hypothetical protein [Microvirga brassicacearum]KAB0264440.1 hypothetical protein FEZ63_22665 [Microvirga brassicacearum]
MAAKLTYDEVKVLIGPANDKVISEILDTAATQAELVEARAWIENDEVMLNEGRAIPSGRIARLVELLKAGDEDLPVVPKL